MYKLIYITLSIFLPFGWPQNNKYDVLFADEYRSAMSFTAKHAEEIKQAGKKYNNEPSLLTAIVFPELMRYSLLKDVLETSALELVYIDKGCKGADFSIGRFQMKPSFAEDLERQVNANDSLKKLFSSLVTFKAADVKGIRTERLKRLSSLNWQLIYLNCFVSVVENKFPDQQFATTSDKIQFYATAYNGGYHKASKQIIANESVKYYPYGTGYKGNQYSYAEVADYFHDKTYRQKPK